MTTLRQYRFFVALADQRHFSHAAEICHVTQPTLSAGVRELEAALGVQLAERTRRSVVITPAGREVAERARALLRDAAEIERLAAAHGAPGAGPLRIGAIPTIGPYLLPRALPRIRAKYPDLKLYLREELTESLLAGLNDGRLDAALIALPFETGALATEPLFDDGYHLAVPARRVAAPVVTRDTLDGARLMLLEKGHCLQEHALKAYPDRDISQDESFSATSLATLIAMVAEGLGVTLLPDLAVDAGVLEGQAVRATPLPEACPRHIVLAWRATSAQAALFRDLAGLLRAARPSRRPAPRATDARLRTGNGRQERG